MASYDYCTVERDGHLLFVTLNRPGVMNALHPPANFELALVFDEFAADPELWVAIITGAGDRAFCAGNDLKFQAAGNDMGQPDAGFGGIANRFGLNKPIIAAVNGVAMGGGFEIALACDIIVASDNALFALPEPKVGLAALAGGLARLPRHIGMKRAMSMILTGRHVPAAEGASLGFVAEVVSQAELMDTARRWANMILECSPMSIQASKEAAYASFDAESLETAVKTRYPATNALFASDDFVEGPLAFSEKRPPQWKGR
ncbi:MAG: enoyl-CoA hydratase-related protein [Pseudomonadota bacterium]